jgi:hypothetical protein
MIQAPFYFEHQGKMRTMQQTTAENDIRIGARMIAMTIPLDAIDPHPDNPNTHDEEQVYGLEESAKEFGQFRSFVVWQRPNGRFTQVTSHGITTAMRNRGEASARVEVLPEDTSPLIVKRIMLADNQHARKSADNPDILLRLLQEQQHAGYTLLAIGTDDDAVQSLLDQLDSGTSADVLPEPGDAETSEVSEQWGIIVTCHDEDQQLQLLERFQEEGLLCRALVL